MPAILTLKIDAIFFRKLLNGARKFEEMSKWQTNRRLKARLDGDFKHHDIFEKLEGARDGETGQTLTAAELNAEAIGLIIAGTTNLFLSYLP